MKSLLLIFVIFGMYEVCAVINAEPEINLMMSDNFVSTEIKSGRQVEYLNETWSSEKFIELYDLVKNLSHSKGMFREVSGGIRLRRSVLKKFKLETDSFLMERILLQLEHEKHGIILAELLEQLEYLVHDYGIAVNFANLGGLTIISRHLLSTDVKIVSTVALVLGSAMQSNPVVQNLAVKENVAIKLLDLLSHKSPIVISRTVFALSCFLRNAPKSQQEFISINGVSRLADVLNNVIIISDVKLKIITLFEDIVLEQETAEQQHKGEVSVAALRRLFASEIKKLDICRHIAEFLTVEDYNYRTHEKIISSMLALDGICYDEFRNELVSLRLEILLNIYEPKESSKGPGHMDIDSELKLALFHKLVKLNDSLEQANTTRYPPKDEL